MGNKLRTDIVCDKATMTKEEAEAYDSFIDLLVELCREYIPLQKISSENQNRLSQMDDDVS